MKSEITTVTPQATRESGIPRILAGIAPPHPPLGPERALAYLRELQPGAHQVALLGPRGVLLAGEEGAPARAARELLRAGGERSLDGSLLAVAVGGHAIGARLPAAGGALAELDLRCAASAVAVRFAA